MTTTPEQLSARLGLAVPQRQPITPWCRGMGCGERLDWTLVDREDGSGLHALCTELMAPAVYAGRPSEAEALELLRDKLSAEPIVTVELPELDAPPCDRCDTDTHRCPGCGTNLAHGTEVCEPCTRQAAGPCMDAWCAKNGRPCGYDVAAHINAHGASILTNPNSGPDKPAPETAPVPAAAPTPAATMPPAQPVPGPTFSAPAGPHPLKAEMIRIIRWADANTARSLQREIGMSEVGVDCLRRLAYSLAGLAPVNTAKDPWFAIVGTAVHAWLADALGRWNDHPDAASSPAFQIEQRVVATDGITVVPGHTDIYRNGLVGDHKIVGPDALKRYRDNGPSNQYRVQLHMNGLGWEQAGWPVDEVALLLYPRSGYLDSMHVWSEPYNRQVALDALARLASVRQLTTVLAPHGAYGNIPASPDKAGCVWCPFYRPGAPADATGCPGK